ncbi:hypothetical protein SERLADRAFT_414460 [Serpula lacrymans var. lacrymans S7.9]|uniref:Uncharacterized protein n=1 Tax=Serpula lacrymans var. lacrymans (strain S7.9) TaxID=578457 RepID=F8NS93_SERL9|nr:uncharacterized protein SERLADRAFT_414460 [Serpula lacrymans var. lacrymans S7.9]EGO26402.1 hypothetical protein SERLADRAFT_414460 [Serpula lacrymans var. lacrymans S7.9]
MYQPLALSGRVYRGPSSTQRRLRTAEEIENEDNALLFLFNLGQLVGFVMELLSLMVSSACRAIVATFQWLVIVVVLMELIRVSEPSDKLQWLHNTNNEGIIRPLISHLKAAKATITTTPIIRRLSVRKIESSHVTEAAGAHFLFEQIEHASTILLLVESMGVPADAFFQENRERLAKITCKLQHSGFPSNSRDLASTLEAFSNLQMDGLDTVVFHDFSDHGFIGKTLSHAIHEVRHHALRNPKTSQRSDLAHILSLTASNLRLEYASIFKHVNSSLPGLVSAQGATERMVAWFESATQADGVDSAMGHGRWWDHVSVWPWGVSPKSAEIYTKETMRELISTLGVMESNAESLKDYLWWYIAQLNLQVRSTSPLANITADVGSVDEELAKCAFALRNLFSRSETLLQAVQGYCCDDGESCAMVSRPVKVDVAIPT